jgi:hypothetical protein
VIPYPCYRDLSYPRPEARLRFIPTNVDAGTGAGLQALNAPPDGDTPAARRPSTALAVPTAKAVFSRIWNGTSQRRLRLVLVVDRHRSWSLVMSKRKLAPASKRAANSRKPATTSKGSGRPKVVARAQRNKQALVRSPRDKRLPPVTGGSPESLVKPHADQKQENSSIENRAAALQAILLSALQEGFTRKTREVSEPMKGLDFSSLMANMQAYQAKLVEVAQANMQFTLEFAQRLATIRSPLEFIAVIAEFTGRRMLMVRKHSREMTAVLTRR